MIVESGVPKVVESRGGGCRKDAEKRAKKIKDGAVSGSWVPGGADG